MPWVRRTFSAYRVCPHLAITSRTWSLMDKWFVKVTPSILIEVTLRTEDSKAETCVVGSQKWSWTDLARLSCRLFVTAHFALRHYLVLQPCPKNVAHLIFSKSKKPEPMIIIFFGHRLKAFIISHQTSRLLYFFTVCGCDAFTLQCYVCKHAIQ